MEIRGRIAVVFPALVLLVVGGVVQGQTFLNHDVAWVLKSSERLLAGGVFGQDIVAANPPLIWWISAMVVGLANAFGVDPIVMLRLCVLGLSGAVLIVVERGLADRMGPAVMGGFLAFLALLFTIGVDRDFAQREHLSVLLCLPWLIVALRRAEGRSQSRGWAIAAGIAAGIGFAFKPHFLAVPALVWLYLALCRRSIRPVLCVETLAILLTGIAYLLAVWFFARPYLTDVAPLIARVYWGFENHIVNVIRLNLIEIALALVACIVAAAARVRHAARLTALACLGFLIAAVAQSKGYSYHFYPVLVLATMSLALSALAEGSRARRLLSAVVLAAGVVISALQVGQILVFRGMNGFYGQQTACLVGLAQTHVPVDGGFMAISTHPYPGFPVANYSHRRWLAASNSRLFLPAIVRMREMKALTSDQLQTLALAETAERAAMLRDLSQWPDLVLVDARAKRHAIKTSDIDFLTFYAEDPAFARLWRNYREVPSCAEGIRAFTLSKED